MPNTANELKHAGRRLLRTPAFSLAAAVTLALGVAATATIFTVVNRVILQPLPYPDSRALVWMDHVAPGIQLPGSLGLSQGLYRYYREQVRSISDLAILRKDEWTLTGVGTPQRLIGALATASLGDALQTRPIIGRWYTEKEAQDRVRVVVLTHAFWSTRFGSDRSLVGRTINLDGIPREVVGVLPPSFAFPDPTIQFYVPERIDEERAQTVGGFNYQSIARLTAGSTIEDVRREMNELILRAPAAFPGDPVAQEAITAAKLGGAPEPLKDRVIGPVRTTLWILLGMVGLVLLIACANVANLFLVRSEERQREVAVRRALGAGRAGVIRYFMAESALLAAAGGIVGLAIAAVAVRLLVRFGPSNLPRLNEVAIDWMTVAWVTMLSLIAAAAFGAIPMLRRANTLSSTLREGGRGSTAGRTRFRVRNSLMAFQVALALVLLVASGLMVRSFLRLRAVNPGFDAHNLLTFDVALTNNDFPDRPSALAFHEQLIEGIRALPGVQSVGAVTCLPLAGGCWSDPLVVRGREVPKGTIPPLVQIRRALPGYFETMRLPVLQGRTHQPSDHQQRTGALVISKLAAELYFPGEDPIGRQMGLMFADAKDVWYTVVGVVGDSPVERVDEKPYGAVYLPATDPIGEQGNALHGMAFTVRTTVPPMSIANVVRSTATRINSSVALGHVRSMEMLVSEGTARMAFTMLLLLIAGSIALLLGAVGIYGVISYVVGQRRNEIGVRMALGARPADVSGMVLRQSGFVVGTGVAVGLLGAIALSRLLGSLLFQISPVDGLTYAAVTAFLLGVAALASWLPARRAAALDPLIALKTD